MIISLRQRQHGFKPGHLFAVLYRCVHRPYAYAEVFVLAMPFVPARSSWRVPLDLSPTSVTTGTTSQTFPVLYLCPPLSPRDICLRHNHPPGGSRGKNVSTPPASFHPKEEKAHRKHTWLYTSRSSLMICWTIASDSSSWGPVNAFP